MNPEDLNLLKFFFLFLFEVSILWQSFNYQMAQEGIKVDVGVFIFEAD